MKSNHTQVIKFLLLLIVGISASSIIVAQDIIRGKVNDESGMGLPYATIQILTGDSLMADATITDTSGEFAFKYDSLHSFIKISYLSYLEQAVFLVPGKSSYQIQMLSGDNSLGEVVVSSSRVQIENKPTGLQFNVSSTILESLGNTYDLLERLPGMNPGPTGELEFRGNSSIVVYVNRKRLQLSSDQLYNYLRTIPSNQIDNIFIENNFSARDEASRGGTIIRITLKQDDSLGVKGSIGLNTRVLNKYRVIGTSSLEYSPSSKLRSYTRYSYTDAVTEIERKSLRKVNASEGDGTLITQDGENVLDYGIHSLTSGIDVNIGENTFLNIEGQFTHDQTDANNINVTREHGGSNSELETSFENPLDQSTRNLSFDIYSETTLDTFGSNLTFQANYLKLDQNESNGLLYRSLNDIQVSLPPNRDLEIDNPIELFALNADYQKSTKSGFLFETGLRYSRASIDSDQQIFDLISENERVLNTVYSNDFLFQEDIQAGYIQASNTFKGLYIALGLRAENSFTQGEAINIDSTFTRSIFSLFPSISLYKNINGTNVNMSYSRSIGRPSYSRLNPTLVFINDITFERGNVTLLPQYSHGINLYIGFPFGLSISANIYYSDNFTLPVVVEGFENKELVTTFENIGTAISGGVYINYSKQLLDSWRVNFSSGANLNSIRDDRGLEDVITNALQRYYINVFNTFSLPKKYNLSMGLNYQGPNRGIWESKAVYSASIGMSKKFGNILTQINVNDVFNTVKYRNFYNYRGVEYTSDYNPRAQRITLALTLLLGNEKVNRKRQFKNKGLESEKSRIQ